MSLTQADRISISKKLVEIPTLNKQVDSTKAQLSEAKIPLTNEDSSNKSLINQQTALIAPYQSELTRYNGIIYTTLTEQDFLDSVNRKVNNSFFPNDTTISMPSLPENIWPFLTAFAYTKAIGKKFNETNDLTTKEQDLIDTILSRISVIESFDNMERSTGQNCVAGSCSLPQYTNEIDCVANGGTWNPANTISSYQDMQDAGQELIDAIQAWEDFLNATYPIISTVDTNPTRSAQNDTSRAEITNTIATISQWQNYSNYDTNHGQVTCASFYAYDVNTLNQTKFRADSILELTNLISTRTSFISTRITQLTNNLGTVNQDLATGAIISTSGLYGTRFRFIDMRLNAINGSLSKLIALENGEAAQDQIKAANNNALAAYSDILKASLFRAPATDTTSIQVMSSVDFAVSDSVYIISNTQQEIEATIVQIDGNRIVLDKKIPQKYRNTEFARIYKVL